MVLMTVCAITRTSAAEEWKRAELTETKEGSRFLRSMLINDQGVGLAVGYRATGQLVVVFCTRDFGKSWRFAYQRSHLDKPLLSAVDTRASLAVLSADSFMVLCDNATLLRSSNGGSTWYEQKVDGLPSGLSAAWLKMFNSREGVIVYNKWTVLQTTDGGVHWTQRLVGMLPADTLQLSSIRDIHFFDSDHWYVASDNSERGRNRCMMHESRDGGRSWVRSSAIPSPRLTPYGGWTTMADCLQFSDSLHGWIVGSCPLNTVDHRERDIILATSDAGNTWTTQLDTTFVSDFAPASFGLRCVAPLTADTVYACGTGKLLCSTNGGAEWRAQRVEGNNSSALVEASSLFITPWTKVMCTSGLANPLSDVYYLNSSGLSDVSDIASQQDEGIRSSIVVSSCILLRSLQQQTQVELYTASGEKILSTTLTEHNQGIDCSHIPNGLYVLTSYASTVQSPKADARLVLVVHD